MIAVNVLIPPAKKLSKKLPCNYSSLIDHGKGIGPYLFFIKDITGDIKPGDAFHLSGISKEQKDIYAEQQRKQDTGDRQQDKHEFKEL